MLIGGFLSAALSLARRSVARTRAAGESNPSATKSETTTVEQLRAENGAYRVFTPDEAVAYVREHGVLQLMPLCGGIPPEVAWESLELVASKVLPVLRGPA